MKKFFTGIFNRINKLDSYTNQYMSITNNIEIPAIAFTNWGMHFAQIKDFDTAIEKLETAILMSNQNPKPCISLGIIYAKLKEYEKAENILKKAIYRDSQNAYAYSVLSSVLVAMDKFEEAENALKMATKLSPTDSEVFFNYGMLFAKQQKKLKAIEMLKKSKMLNPTNLHTYFLLGIMFFETNQTPEAFNEFKQLEKIKPDYKNLKYYIALCYKKEKNYFAVIEYAQRAIEEDPYNPSVNTLLAQSYLITNKEKECLETFENAHNKGIETADFYLAWGSSLLKTNRIEEAKEKLQTALEKQPNNHNILHRLGNCYFKEKNYEEAENLYKKAIEKFPTDSYIHADIGMLNYEQKRYDDAIKAYLSAINISKEKSYLYFYVANCYYKLGRLKKSIEYYEKTIEYYPAHLEAFINYSLNLLDLNNTKEALRKIRNASQINRKSTKVMLIYSLIELKNGLYNEAIEKIDSLLEQESENTEAKFIKIQALISLRKPQEAIAIIHSIPENKQNSQLFIYLNYLAYKILVEDSPSNYNENMLNSYAEKLSEENFDYSEDNEMAAYIHKTLNINKGH